MRPKFCLLSLKIRGPQGRPYPRCTKVLKPAATQSHRCDPSDGTNRVPGTWFKNRNPCYREEPYETYFGDRYRAVRFNACTDRVSLGQTGHGPDRHPGRYDDPGPGRSWTRRRSYGSRRAWPSLRLGPRPRASLWLAPSSVAAIVVVAGAGDRREERGQLNSSSRYVTVDQRGY